MVLYALPALGAARLGTLLDPSQLSRVARVEAEDQPGDAPGWMEEHFTEQLMMTGDGEHGQAKSIKPPQHFLAAPGLPTITSKLAPKIWDLEFVEMEEFLPTNRTVQALDQFTPESLRDGVLGALHQFQQQQQQGRRRADIMTWTRLFSLYVAVMAKRRAELVPPMIAHLHAVLRLQQSRGGMAWLQYDWKARREMNAVGTTWETRDPWQLLFCVAGKGVMDDLFDTSPQVPIPGSQHQRSSLAQGTGNAAKHTQGYRPQPYEQGLGKKKLNTVCRLFNQAPAGCPYREDFIFAHRCSKCRREDHGRRSCPFPDTGEERGSLLQPRI